MSYSGIYVHAAPWSVGSQGYTQRQPRLPEREHQPTRSGSTTTPSAVTSSRCVNTVGPTLSGHDGLGDWNIPWEQWKAGNAKA